MAKRFFYICAGLLCLALAYHLGARNAVAQAPNNPIVAVSEPWYVTTNGDVYQHMSDFQWAPRGNVFSSAPVPTQQQSFGQVKARYR